MSIRTVTAALVLALVAVALSLAGCVGGPHGRHASAHDPYDSLHGPS